MYSDTTNPTSARQSELRNRYFFSCSCSSCSADFTNGLPDPCQDPGFAAAEALAVRLHVEASVLPPERASVLLQDALDSLDPYPPHRQPKPSILHTAFLNAIANQSWAIALSFALEAYFYVDPLLYRLSWHPVRVVRKWVLLRLVIQIAGLVSDGGGSIQALEKFCVQWQVVAMGIFQEVSNAISFSHGNNSPFAAEVKVFGEAAGIGRERVSNQLVEEEWVKLRKIAEK